MRIIGVDGTDLTACDMYQLYRNVGFSLDSIISNLSRDDKDDIKLDIQRCQELLDYLSQRVEEDFADEDCDDMV